MVPLRSSSCRSPDLVFAKPFPSAFTTIAFGYSRRRWFETCSCKPVPRGLPSSVKQLRTTQHFSFRARGTRKSPNRRSQIQMELTLIVGLEERGMRADYSGCRSRNSREVFRTFLFAPSVLWYLERPRGHCRGGTIHSPTERAVRQNFEVL